MTERRCAIVTGGGRGIGAAISRRLARDGIAVHLVYRQGDGTAHAVVEDIRSAGGEAHLHKVDVGEESEVNRLIDNVLERTGAVHILVNNAAIIDDQLVAMTALSSWERVLRINLTGPFLMCRAAIPVMIDQGWGRIINISSNSARIPGPGQTAYAASKGGLEAFTRAVANEVGRKGIRANVVAPGRIKTDMTANLREQLGGDETGPRWGVPEDVAGIVAFLASDEADYIQGQTITVDGGRLLMRSTGGNRK